MPSPVIKFFHSGSTVLTGAEVSQGNPLRFTNLLAGVTPQTLSFDIWNDRGGVVGSDNIVSPVIFPIGFPDNIDQIFNGTEGNDFTSMIEMRSCSAFNVVADAQTAWTPVTNLSGLLLGNLPSNSKRNIEVRIRPPYDAQSLTIKAFTFRVSY